MAWIGDKQLHETMKVQVIGRIMRRDPLMKWSEMDIVYTDKFPVLHFKPERTIWSIVWVFTTISSYL